MHCIDNSGKKLRKSCHRKHFMQVPKYKRIAIVGCAGSGKTTLALQLQNKLGLPLHHLDQHYWKPGWGRVEFEVFSEVHNKLCDQDEWIIEGPYLRVLYCRAKCADIIIFLDMPRHTCLWNVIKRSVLNWGRVLPGSTAGCKQRLFSFKFLDFLWWVWTFNKRYRGPIINIVNEVKDEKTVYIVRSFEELDCLANMLTETVHGK